MKVYVLTADTYNRGYGSEISLFGVYEFKEIAEEKMIELSTKGYYPKITEVKLNKDTDEYLGGYVE